MSTPLETELLARIEERGPLPFAAYMSLALYHTRHGYYTGGPERVGWRGHYLTSPELDPAFGELWGRAFEQFWRAVGSPDDFSVVEIGPGEGGFAAGVLEGAGPAFRRALRYVAIERSPAAERRQRERLDTFDVAWHRDVSELSPIENGCIFANEVLDNLPVHLLQKVGGRWLEVCVGSAEGRLETVLLEPSNPTLVSFAQEMATRVPEGHRIEVPLSTPALIKRLAHFLGRGALVFVDYGASADDLVSRPRGSITCYSDTGVDEDFLARPGEKDITCHANWSVVSRACRDAGLTVTGPLSQRTVLQQLGLREVDSELRREHDAAVASGRGVDAVRALSRRQALGALADPQGLGALGVLVALKGIQPPSFMTDH
ncbi:MAG: SAM-dependent methyltransferase [Actinomycetota bacterium]|nr:SAM-dependent methyltransferase [Actinomycetota bacterium]